MKLAYTNVMQNILIASRWIVSLQPLTKSSSFLPFPINNRPRPNEWDIYIRGNKRCISLKSGWIRVLSSRRSRIVLSEPHGCSYRNCTSTDLKEPHFTWEMLGLLLCDSWKISLRRMYRPQQRNSFWHGRNDLNPYQVNGDFYKSTLEQGFG